MSASILSRPIKSGSNWNALGNPVIFKLQRQDHAFDQIANNGGFVQLRINGTDVTSYYQVGNTVYYEGAIFARSATITASSFSTHTLITVDVAFVSTDVGIINNMSKRTDYRLEYNFKSISNVELLGADLAISPDSEGIMLLNASLLKNLLTADWTLPGGTVDIDTDGSIDFYLSYQEYYDGVLQGSVTNDIGNSIVGLLGANQIGSPDGSNMLAYYPADNTRKWLTRFYLSSVLNGLRMWRDWPFTISFISIADLLVEVKQYDIDGNLLLTSYTSAGNPGDIIRVKTSPVLDATKRVDLQAGNEPAEPAGYTDALTIPDNSFVNGIAPGFWTNIGSGVAWGGSGGQIASLLSTGQTTNIASIPTGQALGSRFLKVDLTLLVLDVTEFRVRIYFGLSNVTISGPINSTGVDQIVTLYVLSNITGDIDLGFSVEQLDGPGGSSPYAARQIDVTEGFLVPMLLTIPIEVSDACDYNENNIPIPWKNPILLQWKNSVGGDAFWLFPMSHESSFTYRNGIKTRRITLYDNNLTPVQWEAINELNSDRQVYKPAIIDLENTNTVNATSKMVGQQVYMVAQDGSKTGVIVIPSSDRVFSRRVKHAISIDIELPETFEA